MVLESRPTFEEMWHFIGSRLKPRGSLPDKASLDYNQAFELYTILLAEDMMFRELAQIAILRRETSLLRRVNR